MARQKTPRSGMANLSTDQMRAAITKLERRIAELESFDVDKVSKRFDPVGEAVEKKINSTLQDILGHDTVEYQQYSIWSLDTLPLVMGGGPDPINKVREGYQAGIARALAQLRTLKEIFEERVSDSENEATGLPSPKPVHRNSTRRVFVVHGHDEGAKDAVARYLSALDLEPVILHEKPNEGRTIIEKFEVHSEVDFAVVLFTPDDIGYPANSPDRAQPRPRQNVVLELGFFIGVLGRHRVCVLFRDGVEMPSDYSGVLFVPIDDAGAWRFLLAREIKASGMDIDLNLVS